MTTIKDVAQKAGVSPAAVSRILNGDSTLSVAPETRQKVLDVAEKLQYKKKHAATKNIFKLGVVQWTSAEEELQDSYYLLVRQGIEDFCQKNSIFLARVFKSDANYMDTLKDADGIICVGKFSKTEVKHFTEICRNIVFLDMPVDAYNITTLTMDFEYAVKGALTYLYEMGHKKIAFLGGREYVGEKETVDDERKKAYLSYMKKKKLDYKTFFMEGEFTSASGYEMMKKMLEGKEIPTAVFAASDAIAIGAMKAIKEKGLYIPEDISIIGFNDMEMSAYTTPALTTIHAPAYDMGQHGANLLYVSSNLSISTPLKVKIPCYLVKRDSCAEKNKEF